MEMQHLMAWGIFVGVVVGMLGVDLLVLHRHPRKVSFREALVGTLLPVGMALVFMAGIYWAYEGHFLDLGMGHGAAGAKYYPTNGGDAAVMFFTGYVVELSLSADNVFLFVLLMGFFKVPRELQHRVLFWGVLGALVMRGLLVVGGAALLERFEWVIYVFGVFLLFAGVKMLVTGSKGGGGGNPERSLAVRVVRKVLPIHGEFEGTKFFTRNGAGRLMGTSLLLVLVCIEITDLVFALDSIPAIFGITRDAFIVFTSNVFAVLGLRSMYFLLAGVMERFCYLKVGLAVVLGFVGVKMMLPGIGEAVGYYWGGEHIWEVDRYVSLGVIVGVLGASVGGEFAVSGERGGVAVSSQV